MRWLNRIYVYLLLMTALIIVDDSAEVRHMLCKVFTCEADFDVCGEAVNGREAIEKAQELQPDLIVLGLSMPVMNGLDAARALKRFMPTIPIIMFSAYADTLTEKEAQYAGISILLPKSETVSLLVTTARSLLHHDATY